MSFNNAAGAYQRTVTKKLQSATLTILAEWGVQAISILNESGSTTNGTFNGGAEIGGLTSEDFTIAPTGSRTIVAQKGTFLVGQVITSPADTCTLQVILLIGSNS